MKGVLSRRCVFYTKQSATEVDLRHLMTYITSGLLLLWRLMALVVAKPTTLNSKILGKWSFPNSSIVNAYCGVFYCINHQTKQPPLQVIGRAALVLELWHHRLMMKLWCHRFFSCPQLWFGSAISSLDLVGVTQAAGEGKIFHIR